MGPVLPPQFAIIDLHSEHKELLFIVIHEELVRSVYLAQQVTRLLKNERLGAGNLDRWNLYRGKIPLQNTRVHFLAALYNGFAVVFIVLWGLAPEHG